MQTDQFLKAGTIIQQIKQLDIIIKDLSNDNFQVKLPRPYDFVSDSVTVDKLVPEIKMILARCAMDCELALQKKKNELEKEFSLI